jgi:hypothetical protein
LLTGCAKSDFTPVMTFTVTGAPGETVQVTIFGRDNGPNFVDGPKRLDDQGKYRYVYKRDWTEPSKLVALRLDPGYATTQLGCSISDFYQGSTRTLCQPDISLGPQAKVVCIRTS